MPLIDQNTVNEFVQLGQNGNSTNVRGKALEDLVCYIFGLVPGIAITHRNEMNVFNTEEIDVALWNEIDHAGFYFPPNIILVECKNWSSPVSSVEVNWFDTKLRNRGLDFGILIATNGITGNQDELTAAHLIIANALKERRRLIVVRTDELAALADTDALAALVKRKFCDLAVKGGIT